MKPIVNNAFANYYYSLWFLGCWPQEEPNFFQTMRFAFSILNQILFALVNILECYAKEGNISDKSLSIYFGIGGIICGLKSVILKIHRQKIDENFISAHDDWIKIKDENHLALMKKNYKIYRYGFLTLNSLALIISTLHFIGPVLIYMMTKSNYIPGSNMTFEVTFNTDITFISMEILIEYFWYISIALYVQTLYCVLSTTITDCLFFGMSTHLGVQFQILRDNLIRRINNAIDEAILVQRKELIELLNEHRKLIKLGENLEHIFNISVSLQLFHTMAMVCVGGCRIIVANIENDYSEMIALLNTMVYMIMESSIYGYGSDFLMEQSETMIQAIYETDWYNFENSFNKDLVFVMMACSKPIVITAAKFTNITRNTILQVVKTSFSFFSVFRITVDKRLGSQNHS